MFSLVMTMNSNIQEQNSVEDSTFNCGICGNEFRGTFTIFHMEQTCLTCGAPYQLKNPNKTDDGLPYPRIAIPEEWIPIFKGYWEATKKIVRGGFAIHDDPEVEGQRKAFSDWVKEHHPEMKK